MVPMGHRPPRNYSTTKCVCHLPGVHAHTEFGHIILPTTWTPNAHSLVLVPVLSSSPVALCDQVANRLPGIAGRLMHITAPKHSGVGCSLSRFLCPAWTRRVSLPLALTIITRGIRCFLSHFHTCTTHSYPPAAFAWHPAGGKHMKPSSEWVIMYCHTVNCFPKLFS